MPTRSADDVVCSCTTASPRSSPRPSPKRSCGTPTTSTSTMVGAETGCVYTQPPAVSARRGEATFRGRLVLVVSTGFGRASKIWAN